MGLSTECFVDAAAGLCLSAAITPQGELIISGCSRRLLRVKMAIHHVAWAGGIHLMAVSWLKLLVADGTRWC